MQEKKELWDITSTLPNIEPDQPLDMGRPDIRAVHVAYACGYRTLPTEQTAKPLRSGDLPPTLADTLLTLPGVVRGVPLDVTRVDVRAVLDAFEVGYQELLRDLCNGDAKALL